ncbi:unnamed protein product [Brachionus calyciflorus]|uniref:Uncharacterized protein n=1 Tax=Brachionus calyciflorus TaxID=104777 RepID=A0A813QHU1_9BILA|nr:unnamed protein product [Brachionus calyciflorus]
MLKQHCQAMDNLGASVAAAQVLVQTIPLNAQLSQLELSTGASRTSQSVPSAKESNRFRIVKTDADRKSESVDESVQTIPNDQVNFNSIQNISNNVINNPSKVLTNLNGNTKDVNSIQQGSNQKTYQRGRWFVSEFSTDNNQQVKQANFNQALINGQTSLNITTTTNQSSSIPQTQIKNDENTNFANGYINNNQTPSVNTINPSLVSNPVLNTANLLAQNQSSSQQQNSTPPIQTNVQNPNFYLQNQVYQPTQPTQTYQIINQTSSSITSINQPTQILQTQINNQSVPIVNNNFVTSVTQLQPSITQSQQNQSNILVTNQPNQNLVTSIISNNVTDNNTQSIKQQNFTTSQPINSLTNQPLKQGPTQTLDNLTIAPTQNNNQILNPQLIPPSQQTSPKDQNLVKQQQPNPLLIINENNPVNSSNDSENSLSENSNDPKKSDGGIHDRIALAMDEVKSLLTQAVRDEIVALKNQIKQLKEYNSRLEQENLVLKKNMPSDTLRQLEGRGLITVLNNNSVNNLTVNENEFRNVHDSMISSFTEHVNNNLLNNIQSASILPKINGNLLQEQINLVESYTNNKSEN